MIFIINIVNISNISHDIGWYYISKPDTIFANIYWNWPIFKTMVCALRVWHQLLVFMLLELVCQSELPFFMEFCVMSKNYEQISRSWYWLLFGSLQLPKVKAFIDRVIKSPLHDIAIPLSGFRWEYNKVTWFWLDLPDLKLWPSILSVIMVSGKFPPLEATVSPFWYIFQDLHRM